MNNLEKIFSGNWDEIQGKLKTQWGKLTDNDLKKIDGSLNELVGKLEKHYGYESAKIEAEIADFLKENNLDEVKSKAKSLAKDAISRGEDLKKIISESITEYFDKFKKSSNELENNVIDYAKTNPFKTAGIMLLTGIAVGALFCKKNN